MGAIKTMKEVESALPQKKEINYVRALDKDRNPILINKEDLAQVVGELMEEATVEKAGLLSPELLKMYPHFVKVHNAVYKIAANVGAWDRNPILLVYTNETDFCIDTLAFVYTSKGEFRQSLNKVLYKAVYTKYYKKDNEIFVCFGLPESHTNKGYILSPYGVELVGTPDIIDETFIEITEAP